MNKGHYYGLDCLRCAAAILVLLNHFGLYGWYYPSAQVPPDQLAFPILRQVSQIGSVGVEVFFLISGFVIASSALNSTSKQFILNRAIRLLPALWISGLIALLARVSNGECFRCLIADFARSAILSPMGPYIDGVVWSLVVELVFYLLIYIIIYLDMFSFIDRAAKLLGIYSSVFVIVMATATFLSDTHPKAAEIAVICGRFPFKVFLCRYGVFFSVGILLWSGFTHGFSGKIVWMGVFSVICSIEISFDRTDINYGLISIFIWWIGLLILISSVAFNKSIMLFVGSGGERTFRDLGNLSYPLYLNHYQLGLAIVPYLAKFNLSGGAVFVLSASFICLLSYIVMRLERFSQRYLRPKARLLALKGNQ